MISLKIESKPKFILLLIRLRCSCLETRSLLSVVYLFLSLTGGTPRKLVRHHRSGVQKKQDDTRQSSNGPPTRTPSTHVITTWETNCDLKNMNFYETAVFRFLTLRLRINLEISIL